MDVARNSGVYQQGGYTMDVARPSSSTYQQGSTIHTYGGNTLQQGGYTMDVARNSGTWGNQMQQSTTYYQTGQRTVERASVIGDTFNVNGHTGYLVSQREGRSSVVGTRELGSRVVGERYLEKGEKITYHQLPEIVHDNKPILGARRSVRQVETMEEEAVIVEKYVDKPVEVIVERKVPREVIVEVPYDIIVEKPVEKIIEKEIEIEKLIEKEVEKTVHVPIEKIVQIPIEQIEERHVPFTRYVDVPYERIQRREVQEQHENIVYDDKLITCDINEVRNYPNAIVLDKEIKTETINRYVPAPTFSRKVMDNVIENIVEKHIPVPKEIIQHREVEQRVNVPVYSRNIHENEIRIPQINRIERPVEHIVEVPIYKKNIIKRPVPIQRTVEEIVHVEDPYDVIQPIRVEVADPRFNTRKNTQTIEREVIKTVDVPRFYDVNVDLDEAQPTPLHLVQEKPVTTEIQAPVQVEYLVHKEKPVPEEEIIEVAVPRFSKNVNETILERPVTVTRIVEKPVAVETDVFVEVINKIERPVYEEVIEERPYLVNREVIEYYDVIRENIIEVEREEDVEVVVKTRNQIPRENEQILEERVAVQKNVIVPVEGREINEGTIEIQDEVLAQRLLEFRSEMSELHAQNAALREELRGAEVTVRSTGTNEFNTLMRQLADLRAQRSEIQSRITLLEKDSQRLYEQSQSKAATQHLSFTTISPEVWELRRRLESLLAQNRQLVSQARMMR